MARDVAVAPFERAETLGGHLGESESEGEG